MCRMGLCNTDKINIIGGMNNGNTQANPWNSSYQGKLDIFIPLTVVSSNWKHWKVVLDLKACGDCRSKHGKIYGMNDITTFVDVL